MKSFSYIGVFSNYICRFFILFILLSAHFSSRACSPLNAPNLLNQVIAGNFLNLTWQSTTTWFNCPDVIDVEIACDAMPFSGLAAYTFTSAALSLTASPQTYPVQSIDISSLCPGMVYKFRSRQRNQGSPVSSGWSAISTFTMPGNFVNPVVTLVPSQNVICPGQTASISITQNACGNAYSTFSWSPSTGLSCNTCSMPVASPTITTNYTVVVMGNQLACWTQTADVTITVANPTVVVNTPSICPGETATITASGASNYFWSFGAFPTGPATGGAAPFVTTNYTVTGNIAGCTSTALATVFVYTLPTIAVNNPNTCLGQSINLTANGASSYTWQGPASFTSNVQNPSIAVSTLPMQGTYTVFALSAQGCTASAISLVGVQPPPAPVILSNSPACLNSVLSFTGSGAASYVWTGPDNFSSNLIVPSVNNVSPAAAGVYTMIGTFGVCSVSVTTTVTLKPLPNPVAQSNSPVCAGKTLSLTGAGGVAYSWLGPAAYISASQNPSLSNVQAAQAGLYTLAVTGTNNCSNTITTNVVINPLPVITGSNLNVCLGQNINLNANNGATYSWNGPGGYNSALQNPVIGPAGYAHMGQYTLTVTSALGCSVAPITTVTILSLPPAGIVSTNSLCANSILFLSGTGGNSYTWSGPNGFSSSAINPAINNIPVAGTGVYTVYASIGTCVGMATKTITVWPLPTEAAANTSPACDTKSLQLTSGGAANCVWTGPDGFSSTASAPFFPGVNMATAGIYTLVVTDHNNCQFTSSTQVIIYPNPIVAAVGATVCTGQQAILTASGGVTYQWVGPGGYAAFAQQASVPVVNNNNVGTYTVVVGSVNTCTTMFGVNVAALALPVPSLVVTPRACIHSTISLEAFGGVAYEWNGPGDFRSTDQTKILVTTSTNQSGTYTLTAINSVGCPGYTTTNIIIDPLPDGVLDGDEANRCVPFCDNFRLVPIGGAPVVSTIWKINGLVIPADTFHYCISEAGNHLLTGVFQDANGCVNTTTFAIEALPVPVADFTYDPAMPVEGSDVVVFTDLSQGDKITRLSWAFINNNGYKTNGSQPAYVFEQSGTFPVSLVVKNHWGCMDTVVKPVKIESEFIIFVPNTFTPNGDDKNEFFQPKGLGVVEYFFVIYDRWGEKLFETNNFTTGWDGTYKDKLCKSDVYQWRIKAGDGKGKTKDLEGHVTLYR